MINRINVRNKKEEKVSHTKKSLSWILIIIGITILLSQTIPFLISYTRGEIQLFKQNSLINPLPEYYKQYIEDEFAYYDPGKTYFENLSKNASNLDYKGEFSYEPSIMGNREIIVDEEYDKNMYITIKNIGIENIRITPNVESSERKVYDKSLKFGVAHFKGTPLPGDGGNSFIYGHSAVPFFFNRHSNLPQTIFTKLENIDIGEMITIQKDENNFEYVVRNKKIVASDDFSILKTQGSKETVTLMTCWPLGAGTKRLVIVAERL
jgi:LPXTG-site transpeptidase (sortase) family protein